MRSSKKTGCDMDVLEFSVGPVGFHALKKTEERARVRTRARALLGFLSSMKSNRSHSKLQNVHVAAGFLRGARARFNSHVVVDAATMMLMMLA